MACASCCNPPPTEAPTLESRTASKSLSKCGYTNPNDGKMYLTRTKTWDHNYDLGDNGTRIETGSEITEKDAVTCTNEYSGGARSITTIYQVCSGDNSMGGDPDQLHPRVWDVAGVINPSSGQWTYSGTQTNCGNTFAAFRGPFGGPGSGGSFETEYVTEYVTSLLISNTIAAIPDLGEWDGAGGTIASSNLTATEASYSAVEGEWRVSHSPQGTCYLKVWVDQTFNPEDAGEATVTEVVYEWDQTSGTPCVTVPTEDYFGESNKIHGPENAVAVPATHGDVTVELARWSFIKGYAPGPGEPNGFPPPGWTPASPAP